MSARDWPNFYSKDRVGAVYNPHIQTAVNEGLKTGWKAAGHDRLKDRVALLIIDAQIGFVHTLPALSISGAIEDMRRLLALIAHEGYRISLVMMSYDAHPVIMISFPNWWRDKDGQMPAPFSSISYTDVKSGKWQAIMSPDWSRFCLEELSKGNRGKLTIWPYHCLEGSEESCIIPPLLEMVAYHSAARNVCPVLIRKGHLAQTEFYSPFKPEIEVPSHPDGELNRAVLNSLVDCGEIWVAGEASSHCVLEGLRTMVEYFRIDRPWVLENVRVLTDCMSPVPHPEDLYKKEAQAELEKMSKDWGIKLVKSTDLYT
ncbi:MAG: hypothetical protein Q7S03_01165 [bacterium]|nr:hypothetical protein [bacterium]